MLSEPAIGARLAQATLGECRKVPWQWLAADYDRIRDRIADVFDDFHDFNARVRVPGGFRLTNTAGERRWNTASGRAAFIAHAVPTDLPVHRARASREQPVFTLTTVRSHDQYNTQIYGLNDRSRSLFRERRALFAHPNDNAALGPRA